jgi:hypothetical protein
VPAGDRVAVLSHLKRAEGATEYAVVHIARFEGGKIAELWDPGQEMPGDSPNAPGMFWRPETENPRLRRGFRHSERWCPGEDSNLHGFTR